MTDEFTLDDKYKTGYWIDMEYGKIYRISHEETSTTYETESDSSESKVMEIVLKPIFADYEEIKLDASEWNEVKETMMKVEREKLQAPSRYVENTIKLLLQKDLTKLDGFTYKDQQEFAELYNLVLFKNSEQIYQTRF